MRRCRELTRSEVMVVVFAVGLVVFILLPATTSQSRRISLRHFCASNQYQLGRAIANFAGDHNGRNIPGNHWNGIAIMAPLPNESGGFSSQPCNEGQLIAGGYLPSPTSAKTPLYCPGAMKTGFTTFDYSPSSSRDFYHNWEWPLGSGTLAGGSSLSGTVDNNYVFRASMDGGDNGQYRYGKIKGVLAEQAAAYPILCDLYTINPVYDFHTPAINVLFGDTRVEVFDFGSAEGELVRDWLNVNIDHYSDAYWFMMLDDYFNLERWLMPTCVIRLYSTICADDILNEPMIW